MALLDVEGRADAAGHVDQWSRLSSSSKREGDALQLLDQRVARLAAVVAMLAAGQRLARLAPHPLPDLVPLASSAKMMKCSRHGLGDLALDLAPRRQSGSGSSAVAAQVKATIAPLLGHRLAARTLCSSTSTCRTAGVVGPSPAPR